MTSLTDESARAIERYKPLLENNGRIAETRGAPMLAHSERGTPSAMLLPCLSTLLLVTSSILGLVQSASVFGRCSATTPCDAPAVCVDNIICLPKEAPTPVFASAPFSLPVHQSPLVLNLPEGLLHQNAPQTAIFLPPARINHSPPQVHPISRVFPVISRVVGEPAIDGVLAPLRDAQDAQDVPEPSYSFRSYPSPLSQEYQGPEVPAVSPSAGSYAVAHEQQEYQPAQIENVPPPSFSVPLQDSHQELQTPLSFFSPSIWQSSPLQHLPVAKLISGESSQQLSLPTARQISIDEVMEEQLPKPKPIVPSFKSYPPPPSPSPIAVEKKYLAPSPIASIRDLQEQALLSAENQYLAPQRLPAPAPISVAGVADYAAPEQAPIVNFADLRLRAHSVAARNPQALPGGQCHPSTECTGGSECVEGICQCPEELVHQGTVCVLRSLYPGLFH